MRDIKFRAWDKEGKVMIDWFWLSSEGNLYETPSIVYDTPHLELERNDDLVAMQYTGKKDVNGVEIYENDILACYGGFTDLGCTLQANVEVEDIYEMAFIIRNCDKYEVIGNIHENPELLEE